MIRHLEVARDTDDHTQDHHLKTIIINAPAALRQALDPIIGKMALIRHLATLRPGPILRLRPRLRLLCGSSRGAG